MIQIKNKKRLMAIVFFASMLLLPLFPSLETDGKFSFSLVYQPQGVQAAGWDNSKIYFDFDGLDNDDSKLIGIFEVNGGGSYDEAIYVEFRNMAYSWPFENDNDETYMYQEMDMSSNDEGCPAFFIGATEGYIIVVGSDTNGGGNWDDFEVRVRIYDDGTRYDTPGDGKYTLGDSTSNCLRFIVYRYTFSGTPKVNIAAKYTWGGVFADCYPNNDAWLGFNGYIDDFWVYSDSYNTAYTAIDLYQWSWPNPY